MSRTLTVPLQIRGRGGLSTEAGTTRTLIVLGLLPTATTNPYDDRDGLQIEDATWSADDHVLEADLRGRVEDLFAGLEAEGRARLRALERRAATGGTVRYAISYDDIEAGASDEVILPAQTG